MSEKRWPSVAHLVSMDLDEQRIRQEHEHHLKFFNATDADCSIKEIAPCPSWAHGKTHYSLTINTYRGWRVYMLHTGCIASIPEFDEKSDAA